MEPTFLDDLQLIAAIQAADTGALGTLYDRYGRLVYSLAAHILNDDALAEEVTQDVFVYVWNKASLFQPEQGKLVTWVCSMARHRAIDVLRRQNVRPEGHASPWADGISPDLIDPLVVEPFVEAEQQRSRLRKAIAGLPAEQQEVVALAYFQGYSHQDIADALHQPLGTIKTRLRLAMQKLRQTLIADSVSAE